MTQALVIWVNESRGDNIAVVPNHCLQLRLKYCMFAKKD